MTTLADVLKWGPQVLWQPRPATKGIADLLARMDSEPLTATWGARTAAQYLTYYATHSALQATLRVYAQAFAEPPLKVYRRTGADLTPLPDHPLQTLLDHPNPFQSQGEFKTTAAIYRAATGAAYLYKTPTTGGKAAPRGPVGELYPYPHGRITPATDNPRVWITHYLDHPDPARPDLTEKLDLTEVVQWNWLPHPFRPGWGLGAIESVADQLDTDQEMTRYIKALWENDATPRGKLIFPPAWVGSEAEKTAIKRDFTQGFGGRNRGKVIALFGGMDYQRIALALNELDTTATRNGLEARIAAAVGVPLIVVQLWAGVEQGHLAMYETALKQFTQQTLVPAWTSFAGELTDGLAVDYGPDVVVAFDLSQVAALNEHANDKVKRLVLAAGGPVLTPDEARADLGKDPTPGGADLRTRAVAVPPDPGAAPGGTGT